MTKITEEIKKLLAEEKRMHREAITYIDKAPKGVLKYHGFFELNHKVIFDYLFKSSYMPVQPIVTGFSGIFRYGRYSQIFLYPRMF